MKYILISLCLFVALLLQTAFIQMPFVLIGLLLLGIIFKEQWVFLFAFVMGILLDMVSFRAIGVSSLFFVSILGMVFLYERKFEIQSFFFVGFSSFFSLLFYILFFGSTFWIGKIFLGMVCSLVVFLLITRLSHSHSQRSFPYSSR